MTVGDIWQYCLEQMLKEFSGGWIRPNLFNNTLNKVNLERFNEAYARYEKDQDNTDDLRPFVITQGDGDLPALSISSDGYIDLPADYFHLSSVTLLGQQNTGGDFCNQVEKFGRPAVVLTDDQFNTRRRSSLLKPTVRRPICTIQNNKIRVLPVEYAGGLAQVTYIRKPATPFLDWKLISVSEWYPEFLPAGELHDGTNLPNGTPSRTVELEWPEQYHQEFAETMLRSFMQRMGDQRIQTVRE